MTLDLFFDTYALVAIFEGKEAFRPYATRGKVTTRLNLMEFTYVALRAGNKASDVEGFCASLLPACVLLEWPHLERAARFRLQNPHLSYVDCLGYLMARDLGIPFLTGDDAFRGKKGVEFVK